MKALIPLYILIVAVAASAQTPTWVRSYGGEGNDIASGVIQTRDEGYLLLGNTSSRHNQSLATVSGYIVKTSASGEMEWDQTVGEGTITYLNTAFEVSDGYIIIGRNADPSAFGIYVFRLEADGTVRWTKTLPTGSGFSSNTIDAQLTSDGGLAVLSGDLLVRTDSAGNILWQKNWSMDFFHSMHLTPDGVLFLAGAKRSSATTYYDTYIAQLDPHGDLIWDKSLSDSNRIAGGATEVRETAEGYLLLDQYTNKTGGTHTAVVRLDAERNIQSQNELVLPRPYASIDFSDDNQLLIILHDNTTPSLMRLMKTDLDGNIVWERNYGEESKYYFAVEMQPTPDGGTIVVGNRSPYIPNQQSAIYDMVLLKFGPDESSGVDGIGSPPVRLNLR